MMKKKSFKTAHIGNGGARFARIHVFCTGSSYLRSCTRSYWSFGPRSRQRRRWISGPAAPSTPHHFVDVLTLNLSPVRAISTQPPASILVSSLRPALPRTRGVQRGSEDQKWPWSRAEAKITLPPRLAGRGRPASLGDANGARLRLAPFGAACQSRPSAGRSSSLALRPGWQRGLPARPSRPLACRTTLDSPHCHLPKMLRIFLDLRFFIVVFDRRF